MKECILDIFDAFGTGLFCRVRGDLFSTLRRRWNIKTGRQTPISWAKMPYIWLYDLSDSIGNDTRYIRC